MKKHYCPPTGDTPQWLPDYCRFENGTIRRDLQTLDDEELHVWGWEGPFYEPVAKRVIKNTEELSTEYVNELMNSESFEYNEENQEWVSVTYDYDFETHKVVWYSKNREYIIIPIEEDETEYKVLYKSSAVPPQNNNSNIFASPVSSVLPTLSAPPVLWEQFRNSLVSSLEFNQYIASLMSVLPIVATSFPVSILQLEIGKYSSFKILWETLKNANLLPPEQLTQSLIALANQHNLPQDFINILTGE